MDQPNPNPNVYVENENLKSNASFFALGIFGGIAAILIFFFFLNYFNILSLSTLFPNQLGWMPYLGKNTKIVIDPNTPIITIDNKVITHTEYSNVLNYVNNALKDKAISIERTNYLFIANELLKRELLQEGKPLTQTEFQDYLNKQAFQKNYINSGQKLELEVAYLKDKLSNTSLTWYSGEYYLVRFENSLNLTQEEKKNKSKAKINSIRNKVLAENNFKTLAQQLKNDQELDQLNDGQGFAGTFQKMTLKNPTVTAPELLETIKKIKPGQVSEVFIFSDPKRKDAEKPVPFAYGIVKLTDYHYGISDSFEEWYKTTKNKSKITINNSYF